MSKALVYKGRCLCNKTTYTAKDTPHNPHLCSCTMCQKSSGAPTVAWVEFPLDVFTWDNTNQLGVYPSSEKTQRCFCKNCGGLLATLNEGYPNIHITIASLENPNLIIPNGPHSFEESAPMWWKPWIKNITSTELEDSLTKKENGIINSMQFLKKIENSPPLSMSILMRKMNSGVSYEDFRTAWLPPVDNIGTYFKMPVLVLNSRSVTDPSEIISVALIGSEVEQVIDQYKDYQSTEDIRQEKIEKITSQTSESRFCKILNVDILGENPE